MKKKYWVDDDGYIIYGNDNQVIVCEIYPEHVQELTKIIESHADLLDACKTALKFLDSMATPLTEFQQENRWAFRKIVTDSITKAE